MNRRRLLSVLLLPSLLVVTGCANLLGQPVAASSIFSLARELGEVVELVAARILGPKAPDAFRRLVGEARLTLEALREATSGSSAMVTPDEARLLFTRFVNAYEALWLALEAAGLLGPNGELLGSPNLGAVGERGELGGSVLGDGGTVPSPDDVKARIARRLGGAS